MFESTSTSVTWTVLCPLLLCAGAPAEGPAQAPLSRFEFTRTALAAPVRIALYAPDENAARSAADAAFSRIEALGAILSDYDPASELNRLCASAAAAPVKVSDDLWRVLSRAQEISRASDGAFDATVGPAVLLWRRSRRYHRLPSADELREALALVDYRRAELDPKARTVKFLKSGLRLDLGGIAKGYAADEALAVLRSCGIHSALVDAGGDMAAAEPPPGKAGWFIGVAPLRPGDPPRRYLSIRNAGVATSGDANRFVLIEGRRYSHIVDPRTGLGLTESSSITVVAPDGMTADALATAVSVLGPEKGLALIEGMEGAAGFIARAPGGKEETHASRRWKESPAEEGAR